MHVYVFEPRESRRNWFVAELAKAQLKLSFVSSDFFHSGLAYLQEPGHQVSAILLGESADTHEQIRAVRQAGCLNPLIVIRDFRNWRDTSEALDRGADDVMVNPFKGNELLSRINSIIRRYHGHASDSITIGEVTAFFDGSDPIICGQRVKLSKREHSIFNHLALNHGKVTSRNAIYEAVYAMSLDQPFDKVIDVYICKLRKKISNAAQSGEQYIETVHGRGFKLSAPSELARKRFA